MQAVDIVIAGAGVVGLSLALDLRQRGATVCVLERQQPGSGASRAAAGMLAVHDPGNPPELLALSERSFALYPAYLQRIEQAGGGSVPFETAWCMEQSHDAQPGHSILPGMSPGAGNFHLHPEKSLDPRRLFAALLQAATQCSVQLLSGVPFVVSARKTQGHRIAIDGRGTIECDSFIDCTGAWNAAYAHPIKGQMLRVKIPEGLLALPDRGNVVVRTPKMYLVPRLDGSCLIGATVEDAGFDTEVLPDAAVWLREQAAQLVPALALPPEIESWCGLRPATQNSLPVLGATGERTFVANGLYRNGILLAPVVSEVLSALVRGETPAIDISRFEPKA